MTNTLHRYGDAESFRDDYIVFASPSSDRNDENSVPKLKKFLEMALPFKPVNIGDPIHGGTLRPERNLHTVSNWKRDMTPDFQAVIDGIDTPVSVVAIPQGCRGCRPGSLDQHVGLHRGRQRVLQIRRNYPSQRRLFAGLRRRHR
jgi:hypothetical protein